MEVHAQTGIPFSYFSTSTEEIVRQITLGAHQHTHSSVMLFDSACLE